MQSKRTKILYLITKSTLGGAQQYVEDLATALDPMEFDVTVGVGGDGPLIGRLEAQGVHVRILPYLTRDVSWYRDIRAFFGIVGLLRDMRPDILHINSSKIGVLGSIAGRLCGVPKIIFTAHGWAFNEDRPSWQRHLIALMYALTIYLSHITITVSDGMRKQMRVPCTSRKMRTIHLGRTITHMRTKEDARGVLQMHVQNATFRLIDYHNDFWLGTIAELHPIKQLHRAIDALGVLVKEFPTLRYVIIHDGELRAELEAQVERLHLSEHVFFTGTIENAARLLPAFDAFVLPSKSEAFAYVLLEAGHAHLPVVATRVGGIPDIITENVNGLLVEPENTDALTSALRVVLKNENLRTELADAHYKKVQSFTLQKMVRETQNLYTPDVQS
jgi:glycosyltransferase involved in cell wall biosynthesis